MSKRKFDVTGHPCENTNLGEDFWFYGIVICHHGGAGNPTEIATMPWRMVKRALDDHAKAKDRRRAVSSPPGSGK